ncbi:glycerophosphodiester phosphodiesterase family protein, partial [Rhizobium brockwellii]|uniref:glycerophosphodiester phosphodiesterase family protein n=1 Tax=Rhizobium brockwellii TaxID=3019932 RepID=UPI003F9ACA69
MTHVAWLRDLPVAHRGYHDLNTQVWENTLSAFSRAIEPGLAIESDLHNASDGVPFNIHDE